MNLPYPLADTLSEIWINTDPPASSPCGKQGASPTTFTAGAEFRQRLGTTVLFDQGVHVQFLNTATPLTLSEQVALIQVGQLPMFHTRTLKELAYLGQAY